MQILNLEYKRSSAYDMSWITGQQELLLRACLTKGDSAIEAFCKWRTFADFDNVDPGSYRLFPLLYVNLKSQGFEDPIMNIFKWVYDKTSDNNQSLLNDLVPLLKSFNQSGIEVILLKGAGLILTCYKDYGLRPMMDTDLLVPTGKTGDAINLLTGLGWNSSITPLKGFKDLKLLSRIGLNPSDRKLEDFTDEYFCVRHGQDFTNPEKFTVDLHWHVLHGYNEPDADQEFWRRSVSLKISDALVQVLDPSDMLLHVCSHGMRWDAIVPIRWIADAVWLINNEKGLIDWESFTEASVKHGKVLQAREALKYLNTYLEHDVPDSVIRDLDGIKITKAQSIEYRLRMYPPGITDGIYELYFLYSNYSKTNHDKSFARRMAAFPKFLKHVLGLDSLWQLILYALFELIRRSLEFPALIIKSVKRKLAKGKSLVTDGNSIESQNTKT